MPSNVIVVMDEPALEKFLGWEGPLGRRMELCARDITLRATQMANRRTGRMATRMNWKREKGARGIAARIGTPVPYAAIMELGSRPHEIKPKKPGGYLVFFWPKAGKVMYLRRVMHPGTRPYRFLTRALERGVRANF